MLPILVLGMHRSGTSCLAGLLIAAGLRPPGSVVRNWDNLHGHHEATAAVRLNEAVLAHSGGHWLAPPAEVRWTGAQAEERDRLLAIGREDRVGDGSAALIKDPRTLLALRFWLATRQPRNLVGIVRHPLAVARSLLAWRGMPIDQGLGLWIAHNQALLALRREQAVPLLDFDQPPEVFLDSAAAAIRQLVGTSIASDALRPHYDPGQVHHDGTGSDAAGIAPALAPTLAPALTKALALHQALLGSPAPVRSGGFPWAALQRCQTALATGQLDDAVEAAHQALATAPDPVAVLVPIASGFLRHRAGAALLRVLSLGPALPNGLRALIAGKAHLELGDATAAVTALTSACDGPSPFFEARHLLPQALRRAGRTSEARIAQRALLLDALHPHQVLATLAEWAVEDGDPQTAISIFGEAIATAPGHRRGRLRSRLAELLLARHDRSGAIRELEQALIDDPAWPRAQRQLTDLGMP